MANKYALLNEDKLIQLCKEESDTKAFDELASRCISRVKSYLISKFQDPTGAEEVLQITLIKAWKNIPKYKGNSKFLSWISKIAHNAYYDYKRKYKKETSLDEMKSRCGDPSESNSYNDFIDQKLGLVHSDPHRPTNLKELSKKLNKAISMLSLPHQQVLKMKEIEDLSCSEIS